MLTPDEALSNISKIFEDFSEFCSKSGKVSEADTRSKIIDRILVEGLGWDEKDISREGPIVRGYFDYCISHNGRNLFVVEAKREGIPFVIPKTLWTKRKFRLNGAIKTNKEIQEAIEQVQHYCVEVACRYAVATNGYSWIVFRALRDDIPWRKGDCIIFPSAGEIKRNFTDFWNLLAKDSVLSGSLDSSFSKDILRPRNFFRPTQYLRNPDAPLIRNAYHTQLNPFVENIFRDIGEEGQIEILLKCYVYGKSLQIVDQDLKLLVEDSIPRFLKNDGTVETAPTKKFDTGEMASQVSKSLKNDYGSLFLLLGGIGSGKTTYIKRFFNYISKALLDRSAFCFYVDFLAPPPINNAENFVFNSILDQLRKKYSSFNLESRENLLRIYNDKINLFKETFPNPPKSENFDNKLSAKLEEWTSDVVSYTGRILSDSRRLKRTCVLCIDNVDQLSPEYQAMIFLIAQRAARDLSAVVIVALREESYYSANIRNTFTAYNNRKFHIASPDFSYLIRSRLRYCREVLSLPEDKIMVTLRSGVHFDKAKISNFLNIIEYSIFSRNKNIVRFIEALGFGNMREALDMFSTFLYSGVTNVDKMLLIYERDGNYFVAFHEFAKSIILGDRKYYKDSESKVMNVFDCSQDRNSSHFTTLRLLSLLLAYHNSTSAEGRGFVSIDEVFDSFVDIFDNESDLKKSILRLIDKQLVQLDTRSTKTMDNASYIRITSAGWYYFKYLVRSFPYLDQVFQDTPFDEEQTAKDLKHYIVDLDKLADTQDNMLQRMEIRFDRVDMFLSYLLAEEEKEFKAFNLAQVSGILGESIMPSIREQYEREKAWIQRRVSEKLDSRDDSDLQLDSAISDLAESNEGLIDE